MGQWNEGGRTWGQGYHGRYVAFPTWICSQSALELNSIPFIALPASLPFALVCIPGDNSELSSDNEQDLNKVSEQILARTKETMDVVFEANCVHPGEEGWQYDRQQEFSPDIMEGGWDSDSSSTQEF